MTHQKRFAATKRTALPRKGTKYLTAVCPGPHMRAEALSVNALLRDTLTITTSTRETKQLLHAGAVHINGVVRKDHKFPVGFLDEVSFDGIADQYTLIYNTLGKLEAQKSKKGVRALKIMGKKAVQKGKIQINLFTGVNILLDKDKNYSVGDSVVVEKQKVTKHLKFEKGAHVFLTAGKHVGHQGVVEEIKKTESWTQPNIIVVKTKEGTFETSQDYAYVVDGAI